MAIEKLARTLQRLEEGIRHRSTEKGYVLDPGGTVVASLEGTAVGIDWPINESGFGMDYYDGMILTHNHVKDTSLGRNDLLMAREQRLREIHAVTPHYTHSWKPEMRPDKEAFERCFDQADKRVFNRLEAKVKAGRLTATQADEIRPHLRNRLLQRKYPSYGTYERTPVEGTGGTGTREYHTAARADAAPSTAVPPATSTWKNQALRAVGRTLLGAGAGALAAACIEPARIRLVERLAPSRDEHPVLRSAFEFTADTGARALESSVALGVVGGPGAAASAWTLPGLAGTIALVATERGIRRGAEAWDRAGRPAFQDTSSLRLSCPISAEEACDAAMELNYI